MNVACPFETGTALPMRLPSSANCTVPVNAGPPDVAAITVAVRVTLELTFTSVDDAPIARGRCDARRQHLNRVHHAAVFVLQDVAVIDKRADDARIAEIHAQSCAWIGPAAAPIGQVNRVADGRVIYRLAVDGEHLEM